MIFPRHYSMTWLASAIFLSVIYLIGVITTDDWMLLAGGYVVFSTISIWCGYKIRQEEMFLNTDDEETMDEKYVEYLKACLLNDLDASRDDILGCRCPHGAAFVILKEVKGVSIATVDMKTYRGEKLSVMERRIVSWWADGEFRKGYLKFCSRGGFDPFEDEFMAMIEEDRAEGKGWPEGYA